jgi:hypothetical protein
VKRVASGLITALVAILAACPASAPAATRSQSLTLTANGQEATLVPTCPKGQRATGGGFLAPPNKPTPPVVYVNESRKSGQRSWRVSVGQGGSGALPVTAYAYCDAEAPKTKEKSVTVPVPPSAIATAEARCSGAGKTQAGGFSGPPRSSGSFMNILDSFRSAKKSWRSRGFAAAGSPTLTSYLYCADAGSPKARSGSTSTSLEAPVSALSAPCKRGTHVGAGGFSQPTASFFALGGSFFDVPWESFRSGKRWRHSAQHSGTASTTLNSIAYCV